MDALPEPLKRFDGRQIIIDRILAGTWTEEELDPATRKYAEERRHLYTAEWINPVKKEKEWEEIRELWFEDKWVKPMQEEKAV